MARFSPVFSLKFRKYGRVPVLLVALPRNYAQQTCPSICTDYNFCVDVSYVLIMIVDWIPGFVLYYFF
jgi:hypothetical protein